MSLNKLMASFIFGVLFFFPPIAENTVVCGLLKSCIQLAHEARNVFLTLNSKLCSVLNNSAVFFSFESEMSD